jgi:hypothetical protein
MDCVRWASVAAALSLAGCAPPQNDAIAQGRSHVDNLNSEIAKGALDHPVKHSVVMDTALTEASLLGSYEEEANLACTIEPKLPDFDCTKQPIKENTAINLIAFDSAGSADTFKQLSGSDKDSVFCINAMNN